MQHQMTIEEVLLNPSVKPEDEERLSEQAKRMLTLFQAQHRIGCPVSNIVLTDGSYGQQHNARLNEVRHALAKNGWMIDCIGGEGGVFYYAVVPLKKSTFWRKVVAKGEQWKWNTKARG